MVTVNLNSSHPDPGLGTNLTLNLLLFYQRPKVLCKRPNKLTTLLIYYFFFLRFKQNNDAHNIFRTAAALGKITRDQKVCQNYFSKCKLSEDQMGRIMKVFQSEQLTQELIGCYIDDLVFFFFLIKILLFRNLIG